MCRQSMCELTVDDGLSGVFNSPLEVGQTTTTLRLTPLCVSLPPLQVLLPFYFLSAVTTALS